MFKSYLQGREQFTEENGSTSSKKTNQHFRNAREHTRADIVFMLY